MNVKTRQRLIGFLLLLLLAAILVPLVLRSPEQVRVALDHSIPKPLRTRAPEVAPVVSDQQQQDAEHDIDRQRQAVAEAGEKALNNTAGSSRQDAASGDSGPRRGSVAASGSGASPPDSGQDASSKTSASAKPGPKPALPKAGFTVQVASFSDESNAQALVKRLKEADYSAYYRSVEQDGNTWQRVFVGPEIKRDAAEALNRKLAGDKRFALSPGLVRAFVP